VRASTIAVIVPPSRCFAEFVRPNPLAFNPAKIEETERLIAVYRNADEVIVGTTDEIYSRRGLINRITLTKAEIADLVVAALEQRLAVLRAELGQGD
jgi:uncharacterized small protein (DUF1192 family)